MGELRPEICSLDVATMNSGGVRDDSVMINSPPQLRYMADNMREWGVVPELEVFDVGGVRLAANLIEKGHVEPPGFFQLCLGIEWGAPATPEALSYMKSLLPEGAHWAAFGISRDQLPIAGLSVLSGGHVRTGLEDNLYLGRGTARALQRGAGGAGGGAGPHAGGGARDARGGPRDTRYAQLIGLERAAPV